MGILFGRISRNKINYEIASRLYRGLGFLDQISPYENQQQPQPPCDAC